MICSDFQPLSIVENKGFFKYSKKLQPLYSLPSRKLLSTKLLPEIYEEVKTKLQTTLNSEQYVSITTDIWNSDSNVAYLTVTGHFIFNNKLFSTVLSTRSLKSSHTGQNIANAIESVLNEWNIFDKVVTIVSDNAANMKNAVNVHLKKQHHPCIAHTLNLTVNNTISKSEQVQALLKKCRQLVVSSNIVP